MIANEYPLYPIVGSIVEKYEVDIGAKLNANENYLSINLLFLIFIFILSILLG